METGTIASTQRPRRSSRALRQRWDRRLMVLATVLLVAAWVYGYLKVGTDAAPLVNEVLPGVARVEENGDLLIARDEAGNVAGYAAVGEAPGYGGPITVLVGVDPAGTITGVRVVTQRETPGFFRLIRQSGLLADYDQQTVRDPLLLGQDLDAVSGATTSAEGVANAVRTAVREIAATGLNEPRPPEPKSLQIGVPELVLVLLFAAGYVGHRLRNGAWKRRVRWEALLSGMIMLGFVYTAPLTITMIISLLSGYWPDWHNNLYWYLLIGGILFVTTVDSKNPYCYWFCPFGAVQECLSAVSGAKPYRPRRLRQTLTWVQRGLAVIAIAMGLALRRPGVAGYEPFATLFDLRGTAVEWIFLALILVVSLAIYRPFCHYLCPLDPVVDFVAAGRRWGKELVSQWRRQRTSA